MSSDDLRKQWYLSYLSGSNMSYVDGLYEDYIKNPEAVSDDWRACFQALPAVNGEAQEVSHQAVREYFLKNSQKKNTNNSGKADKQADVTRYIDAFRMMGHQAATLDPLAMAPRTPLQALQPEYYQLGAGDKQDYFSAGSSFSSELMTLDAITQAVHDTYCGNIGIEYMHIGDPAEVNWFKEKMESSRGHSSISAEKKRKVLADLIATDGLERYLATRYVGQKRFSVEGADALIPMLNEIIQLSGHAGVKETLVGMAHRGRLNAMINVFGKAPKELFSEFEGKENHERTGDVKYHLGFSANLRTDSARDVGIQSFAS